MNEKLIEKIKLNITLKLLKVGCDKLNYKILKCLTESTTIKKLQLRFGLTKMPMNKRINELESVGLLKRNKTRGIIESTELTLTFLNVIEKIKQDLEEKLLDLI